MTHLSKITRPHWSIKPHPKNWMNKISKQQADTEQQSDNTAESEQDVTSELATVDIFFFFFQGVVIFRWPFTWMFITTVKDL